MNDGQPTVFSAENRQFASSPVAVQAIIVDEH